VGISNLCLPNAGGGDDGGKSNARFGAADVVEAMEESRGGSAAGAVGAIVVGTGTGALRAFGVALAVRG